MALECTPHWTQLAARMPLLASLTATVDDASRFDELLVALRAGTALTTLTITSFPLDDGAVTRLASTALAQHRSLADVTIRLLEDDAECFQAGGRSMAALLEYTSARTITLPQMVFGPADVRGIAAAVTARTAPLRSLAMGFDDDCTCEALGVLLAACTPMGVAVTETSAFAIRQLPDTPAVPPSKCAKGGAVTVVAGYHTVATILQQRAALLLQHDRAIRARVFPDERFAQAPGRVRDAVRALLLCADRAADACDHPEAPADAIEMVVGRVSPW